MRFKHVKLRTKNIKQMKIFYNSTLLLPLVCEEETSFTVSAGETLISFLSSDILPFYHYALMIEKGCFTYIHKRVKKSTQILTSVDGQEINPSPFWGVDNRFYFTDPDGNIVEVLSYDKVNNDSQGIWVNLCELGLPSKSVPTLVNYLRLIPNEHESESEMFQFYGDGSGVFVLVNDQRNWYPTNRKAEIHPVEVIVEGKDILTLLHAELPYKIIVN